MKFLTTGEFARFCGVSKDTLIYYDRQGILKPRHVSENGYRRYLPEQFYEFDFISILKETGSSLTEIKEQMRKRSPEQILKLVEEKKHILKHECERLAIRKAALEEMSAILSDASRIAYDILTFENQTEEQLELTATTSEFDLSSDDSFLIKYRDYTVCAGDMPQPLLLGVMIGEQSLSNKRYSAYCFFHKALEFTASNKLHIKKAGLYAVFAHKGNTSSHVETYKNIFKEIKDAALTIIPPMYIYDLISNLISPTTEEYATKYCVRVQ